LAEKEEGKQADGKSVVVLGAGIVGIFTALSLLERGFKVTLVDRDGPAEGASHGNAGVISPWSVVPQAMPGIWKNAPRWLIDPEGPLSIRWPYAPRLIPWMRRFFQVGTEQQLPSTADAMFALNRPNVDLYRYHLKGTGKEHLVVDSVYLHVFRDPSDVDPNGMGWRLRAERGVPFEVLNAGELHEMEPALSPDYKAAFLIKDQARATDPGGVGKALAEKALSLGAVFVRATVERIIPQEGGGYRLDCGSRQIEAPRLVLTAGAWSARLLATLGVKVPLEAERGYHLILQNPGINVNYSVMDVKRYFVASLMDAGVRLAGTAEFGGLDAEPNYERARMLKALAQSLFPAINAEDTVEWSGIRPSFPDSLPCIGEVPGHKGLIAAFGHSHYGFGMAPNTGRLAAMVVNEETPNVPMEPYSVDRF